MKVKDDRIYTSCCGLVADGNVKTKDQDASLQSQPIQH